MPPIDPLMSPYLSIVRGADIARDTRAMAQGGLERQRWAHEASEDTDASVVLQRPLRL